MCWVKAWIKNETKPHKLRPAEQIFPWLAGHLCWCQGDTSLPSEGTTNALSTTIGYPRTNTSCQCISDRGRPGSRLSWSLSASPYEVPQGPGRSPACCKQGHLCEKTVYRLHGVTWLLKSVKQSQIKKEIPVTGFSLGFCKTNGAVHTLWMQF